MGSRKSGPPTMKISPPPFSLCLRTDLSFRMGEELDWIRCEHFAKTSTLTSALVSCLGSTLIKLLCLVRRSSGACVTRVGASPRVVRTQPVLWTWMSAVQQGTLPAPSTHPCSASTYPAPSSVDPVQRVRETENLSKVVRGKCPEFLVCHLAVCKRNCHSLTVQGRIQDFGRGGPEPKFAQNRGFPLTVA